MQANDSLKREAIQNAIDFIAFNSDKVAEGVLAATGNLKPDISYAVVVTKDKEDMGLGLISERVGSYHIDLYYKNTNEAHERHSVIRKIYAPGFASRGHLEFELAKRMHKRDSRSAEALKFIHTDDAADPKAVTMLFTKKIEGIRCDIILKAHAGDQIKWHGDTYTIHYGDGNAHRTINKKRFISEFGVYAKERSSDFSNIVQGLSADILEELKNQNYTHNERNRTLLRRFYGIDLQDEDFMEIDLLLKADTRNFGPQPDSKADNFKYNPITGTFGSYDYGLGISCHKGDDFGTTRSYVAGRKIESALLDKALQIDSMECELGSMIKNIWVSTRYLERTNDIQTNRDFAKFRIDLAILNAKKAKTIADPQYKELLSRIIYKLKSGRDSYFS